MDSRSGNNKKAMEHKVRGESGTDAFTIMRLMGHSSVTVSQKYVHPTPESVELAIDRLEKWNAEKREGGTKVDTVNEAVSARQVF